MRARSVREVVENGLCTGCGLCEALGGDAVLQMKLTSRGFLRPGIDVSLPEELERKILGVCPGASIVRNDDSPAKVDPLWGPVVSMHRAHARDDSVRFAGSSGGLVSALATFLLETGEVDGVIQVTAGRDDPLTSRIVISRTAEQVVECAGSRYAPSAPLACLGDVLGRGERFALIGKPCDIAGLRNLSKTDPRVERAVPWALSFFCAGVPSLEGTRELLARLGVDEKEVASVRYRGQGWPGRFRAETRDGGQASLSYADSWGEVLSRHLQFRCKICPDGTGEFADIAAADAWLTADGYPDFEERDGWSAVIARTPRGAQLLRSAVDAGALAISTLSSGELARMQPYQRHRKEALLVRLAALLLAGGRTPHFRGLGLARAALAAPARWPRNFAGAYWRVLRGANRE